MQAIDPQANGSRPSYGLRYHRRIVKPGEVETFHDQVGYWLWEPATGDLIQTVAIPRRQTAMALGSAARDAVTFELVATSGSATNGIGSNPFLESAFKTLEYRIRITINPDHNLRVRSGDGSDGARPTGAIPPHRSKRPDEGR
jgi:hypothetical protein